MELTANKNVLNLPKGYKQTEVGVIHEDWEVKELDQILAFGSGQDYKQLSNGHIPVYGTGGIMTYVDDYLYDGASVGIGRKGTIDKPVYLSGKFWTVDTLFYTYKFTDTIPKFVFYKFLMIPWKDYNEASGVPSLNKNTLGKIKVSLPPLAEQKAIAKVLSDADALIQALEKKIAKKRLIKKGVMQKLLTPKENWIESEVSDIGQPYGGLSGKTKADFSNGNAYYVPFMNVMSNPITDTKYLDSVKINKGEIQNKILKGDLLFNGSSETPEEVGFCSAVLEQIDNLYLNSFCFGFRIFNTKEFDSLFLAYFFRSTLGRKFFHSLAQGATRYNLSKTNFLKSQLTLPTYNDQVHIAIVIRDIDKEIETLEQKLTKYQLAKQGMMQELLTGKTRLV